MIDDASTAGVETLRRMQQAFAFVPKSDQRASVGDRNEP